MNNFIYSFSNISAVEADQQVEDLRVLCVKILQAYRIRLKCVNKREELLASLGNNFDTSIGYDFDKISKNPTFYTSLKNILAYEKMMLKAIKQNQSGVAQKIGIVMARLKQYKQFFESKAVQKSELATYHYKKVPVGDIDKFLNEMINFVNSMQGDLLDIEKRIEMEENFLRIQGGRTEESFKQFLQAWENEVNANEKSIALVEKVISRNFKLLHWWETQGFGGVPMFFGGMQTMAMSTSYVAKLINPDVPVPNPIELAGISAVAGALILTGFLMNLRDANKTQFVDFSRDKQLIRELKKRRKR